MNNELTFMMVDFVKECGFHLLNISRKFGEMGTCFHCDYCSVVHYKVVDGEWETDIICWKNSYFGERDCMSWGMATAHVICSGFVPR
ncbi:MAG: hypothetical protein WC877_00400 [Dehalococcoidales bacterium]|jgi:hypothetical protein